MPQLAWHLEEPRVGQSYPNFYAAQLASKFVKVVLSGAGGDELFGGYPWRYYRAAVNDDFDHYVDKYYGFWQRLVDNTDLKQMFAPIAADVADVWTRDIFRDVFRHPRQRPAVARRLYQPLALLRGEDLPARPVGGRGQALAWRTASRPGCPSSTTIWSISPCDARSASSSINLQEVIRLNENEAGRQAGPVFPQDQRRQADPARR